MTTYHVMYQTTASFVVDVVINDDGMSPDEAREAAREAAWDAYDEQAPGGLCHHCASEIELGGDFDQGEDDDAVWAD